MDVPEHIKALSKAKIQLMAKPDSAFFTTICFSLIHEFSDLIPTAATNGKRILFNPKFFMDLDPEERVFLLLHETLHVAYLHVDGVRRGGRCPKKWNQAGDHVINLQLMERGFKMPTGAAKGLADPQYAGMSTEEVYKALPDPPPGAPIDLDIEESQVPSEELQREVQDILVRAQIQSKMAEDRPGTIPGDIQIFLDKLLNPKLPWNRILQKYLNTFAKNDYSYRKPARRFFPEWHLPSLWSQALMDIAVAVDISGSVSDEDFKRFVSEIASILKMMKPSKITLIQFDTQIQHIDKIRHMQDLMQVNFTGRGGTSIGPVLEWATENKPQLLMVFTDGGFYFPDVSTKRDTVWLIHGNPGWTAPFGKVIHYEV